MPASRLTQYAHDGLTFDVVDTGPLDGTPVVLLHGFPQRASSWAAVSGDLHERGARTYALDQRGYSPGARPRSRFAYGVEALGADVLALVDAIGAGPVHLVGHDWGAAVAWSVAGSHPDRIASLTAVSVPHPGAFARSLVSSRQPLRSYYMAVFQLPWLPERVLASRRADAFLRGSGMTREMVERYHREIVDAGALRGGLSYYRSIVRAPRGAVVTKVAVPTTYVWSDGDVALDRKGAELTEQWVTGPYTFEVLAGASHWIPDERPAELAQVIADRAGL